MAEEAEAATTDEVDRAADELYALDPEAFTAARNARAKELARQGAKPAAAAVKALAKPAVTAWALNQVARRDPEAVEALLEAGGQLRHAQEETLAGDASGLRDAARDQQGRIADVLERARDVLQETGRDPNASLVERLTATLRAASTDRTAGELLQAGRLTTDLSPAGFGLDDMVLSDMMLSAPPRGRRAAGKKADPKQSPEQEDRARREALERLQHDAEAAASAAEEAERAAAAAEQEADEAQAAVHAAQERAHRVAQRARAARSAASKARRQAEAAEERVKRESG